MPARPERLALLERPERLAVKFLIEMVGRKLDHYPTSRKATMRRLLAFAKHLFPANSARGRFVRRLVPGWVSPARRGYRHYIMRTEPGLWRLPLHDDRTEPLFSVVIPMFNTPERYLAPLADSLINQSYPHFEAILADASTDAARAASIERRADLDERLRYVRLPSNGGISANTNAALAVAQAPYVVFVDHDDILAPGALNEVACELADDPGIDMFYSDEDLLTEDGLRRKSPSFKPDWSPHMLLHCNYTNHLSVMRRSIVEEVGGLRPEFDGAQDYDLLLRVHSLGRVLNVCHVPLVLYHWREAVASTAHKIGNKGYAIEAGRRALVEYLRRVGVAGEVGGFAADPSWHCVKPRWAVDVAVICAGEASSGIDELRAGVGRTICRPVWLAQVGDVDLTAVPAGVAAVVVVRQPFQPDDSGWLDDLVGVLSLPQAVVVAPLLIGADGPLDVEALDAGNPNVASMRATDGIGDASFTWPVGMVRDASSVLPTVVAVKRSDMDLLANPGHRVEVTPDRGFAVVWGPQRMH